MEKCVTRTECNTLHGKIGHKTNIELHIVQVKLFSKDKAELYVKNYRSLYMYTWYIDIEVHT